MAKANKEIKIEFPPYWSHFSSLQFVEPGLVRLTQNHVDALRAAWEDLHAIYAAKARQSKINQANAKKPRGQRVPDSEASARTLARRKAAKEKAG